MTVFSSLWVFFTRLQPSVPLLVVEILQKGLKSVIFCVHNIKQFACASVSSWDVVTVRDKIFTVWPNVTPVMVTTHRPHRPHLFLTKC